MLAANLITIFALIYGCSAVFAVGGISSLERNQPSSLTYQLLLPMELVSSQQEYESLKKSVLGIVPAALGLVSLANGISLQSLDDRDGTANSSNIDFYIEIADSRRGLNHDEVRDNAFTVGESADAYTVLALNNFPKKVIIVRLLWDRLTMENRDRLPPIERKDAFVRILAALGHEIIGNVMSFMTLNGVYSPKVKYSEKDLWKIRIKMEIAAFRAGRSSLNNLKNKFGAQLGTKLLGDLEVALKFEEVGLQSWVSEAEKQGLESGEVRRVIPLKGRICERSLKKES